MSAEMPCDFSGKAWACEGAVQVCYPGNYTMELLHYTKQGPWSTTDDSDKWRRGALDHTVLCSSELEVRVPSGMQGADPRLFPGCGSPAVTQQGPSHSRKESASSDVPPPLPASSTVAETVGHWVNVDCRDPKAVDRVLTSAAGPEICQSRAGYYSRSASLRCWCMPLP